MRAVYRLVGYDKRTERLEVRVDIPRDKAARAKLIAGMPDGDVSATGDWELTPEQAKEIGRIIDFRPDLSHYEYFLEPYLFEEVQGVPAE
jgi:hypothetical protein